MVEFTQPLELQTWFIQIFSGTPEIFTALALITIASFAGYFRMTGIGLFFMVGLFLLMFNTFLQSPLLVLISVIGGLMIGYLMSKLFTQ